ncbi:MAG: hypothetical protein K2G52_07760 [Muribaculaceae bacterium]|nr:hypothetical protein [Muribaculaceae bacterium]
MIPATTMFIFFQQEYEHGCSISDHQDRRRLNEWDNRILSPDIKKDIDRILSYGYETEWQFANIAKSHDHKIENSPDDSKAMKLSELIDFAIKPQRNDRRMKRK